MRMNQNKSCLYLLPTLQGLDVARRVAYNGVAVGVQGEWWILYMR